MIIAIFAAHLFNEAGTAAHLDFKHQNKDSSLARRLKYSEQLPSSLFFFILIRFSPFSLVFFGLYHQTTSKFKARMKTKKEHKNALGWKKNSEQKLGIFVTYFKKLPIFGSMMNTLIENKNDFLIIILYWSVDFLFFSTSIFCLFCCLFLFL